MKTLVTVVCSSKLDHRICNNHLPRFIILANSRLILLIRLDYTGVKVLSAS